MKKRIIYIVLIGLIISLVYISCITNIPDSIILFENEDLEINKILGIEVDLLDEVNSLSEKNVIQTVTQDYNDTETVRFGVELFGIKVKEISVDILEEIEVVPLGGIIGMKLYTKGVLVVGMSEIYGEDNRIYKPYENAGIKEGDTIIKIDDEEIFSTEDLVHCINGSNGEEIKVTYLHNEKEVETNITPIQTEKNNYKIGLWVRDAAAGVGTSTFYDKKTGSIAMLGHGILDIDTEELIDISDGEITKTNIISIVKGKDGKTGRIQGIVEGQQTIGEIQKNTYFGVYGKINNINELNVDSTKTVKVGTRDEIQTGQALILCTLDDGKVKEYEIEIEKIYLNNNTNNKSMLVRITDQELLEKTGGIVQGMSGSPIIQNGKLVGALTHVLVQNPKQGYAVFADIMIKEMKN